MTEDSKPELEGEENTVDLSPDKQIYRSAAVDVSPVDAIEELVDNALDNWMRTSQRVDDINITIEANDGYTRVSDDTGGLGRDRIKHLFALGKTFQQEVQGAIGAYGIGAKKAIVRLGDTRVVKSRDRDAEQGYGFTVDEEWLESDDWKINIEEFDDLEPGETELIMETDNQIWDEDTLNQLRTQLGKTYKLFIDGSIPDAGHVDLTLNGSEITPFSDPDWSFTPFDGLHPRRYENIELYPKTIDTPVFMNVTVGLMRKGNESISGTTIYCQDRLVTDNEHGEVGGYSDTGRNRIGNWSHHNNRLMVVVELTTTGDGSDLPWDAQKSTIDPHHPVSRAMYHWLSRIVTPYFKADTGKVKKAFVHPYEADSEYAANDGEHDILDYNDKQNVTDKPDTSFDDIKRIARLAEGYAEQGFKYYGEIEDACKPAFDEVFANKYHPEEHGGVPLEDVEVKDQLDADEQLDLEEQEQRLAELVSATRGAGSSKKDALMDAGFMTLEDISDSSINKLSSVDGVGRRLARRLQEGANKRLGKVTDGKESDSKESETVDETDGTEEPVEPTENGDEEAVTTEQETETAEGATGSDKEADSVDTTNGKLATESNASESDGAEASTGAIGDKPDIVSTTNDSSVVVPMRLDREEYEQLRQFLQVDDDNPEALAESVHDQLRNLYPTLKASQ